MQLEAINTVLSRIEAENEAKPYWIVGPQTGRFLHHFLRVLEPELVLEVGTSVGYSALWMAAALEINGRGKVWTIESHDSRFQKAAENIAEAGLTHRIRQFQGHAPEIFEDEMKETPAHIDVAFFDATKETHQEYFDAVFPRMSSGGMIIVDNVQSHRFGQMEIFIKAMHAHEGLQVVELPVGTGLMVARVL